MPKGFCTRCKAEDNVQLHHYAPWEFFGDDADTWAMANLCESCHKLWHDVMSGKIKLDCIPRNKPVRKEALDQIPLI